MTGHWSRNLVQGNQHARRITSEGWGQEARPREPARSPWSPGDTYVILLEASKIPGTVDPASGTLDPTEINVCQGFQWEK